MDKYQKIDRVFDGIKKINKDALKRFEEELGREMTFDEYVEKYIEDVTSNYLTEFVDSYGAGKNSDSRAQS